MQSVTVLARAVHFAATLSLAGVFVFLAVVAEPVLVRAQLVNAPAFRRTLGMSPGRASCWRCCRACSGWCSRRAA